MRASEVRGLLWDAVDLKAGKTVRIARQNTEFYVWVLNLFNQENAYAVYTGTGSAKTTNYLTTDAGQKFLADNGPDAAQRYHLAELNPDYFGNPRIVRFGARVSF
jgi:hypothetical protein